MDRIVVGVDGSPGSDAALRWAVREAQLHVAELELVHGYVVQVHRAPFAVANRELAERTVDEVVDRNGGVLSGVKWSTSVVPLLSGSFAHALVEAGEDADLVVVGSRGLGGFASLLLGSTSLRTAGHAPCPVAVVRGEAEPTGSRAPIVVGVDGSKVSRRALQWAVDEAAVRDGAVVVVHAYDVPNPTVTAGMLTHEQLEHMRTEAHDLAIDVVDRTLAELSVPAGVAVDRVVTGGSPAELVLRQAGPGLTVVGTRGRGALGRTILGSVSQQVLHHATQTVVVVP